MVNVAGNDDDEEEEEEHATEGGSEHASDDEAGSMPVRVWQPKGQPCQSQESMKFAGVQGILAGVRQSCDQS